MYPIIDMKCEGGCDPVRAHPSDAGADLVSKNEYVLPVGIRCLVPTGVKVAIPQGFVGLLFPRSSLSKIGITMTNSVGVIDSDYRGEIMASLIYHGSTAYSMIQEKARIVQLVVVPIILPKFNKVDNLDETARGTGGFGSTGV